MRHALACFGLLVWANAAAAELRVDVLSASTTSLELEIQCQGEELLPRGDYLTLRLAGAPAGGEAGLPALPAAARWLALPPTGQARLSILHVEIERLGQGRVEPVPTPSWLPPAGGEPATPIERIVESPAYVRFQHSQADAVRLGEITSMARQRVVPLRIVPVLFDALSGEISIVRRIRVRIAFSGGESRGEAPGPASPALGAILNPEQARLWRGLPAELEQRGERWRTHSVTPVAPKRADGILPFVPADLQSDEVRLRVASTGLWQLRLSDLIDDPAIAFPTTIPRSHLRLYEKRASQESDVNYPNPLTVDVPFHFLGEPDPAQPISASDVIIFYGQAPRDLRPRDVGAIWPLPTQQRPDNYNSGTVYHLAFVDPGSGSWKRISHASLAAAAGTPQPYFAVSDRFEEDGGYQDNPADLLQPRYQWADQRLNLLEARARLRTPRPDATLRVGFSLTRAPSTGDPRLVDVSLRQYDTSGGIRHSVALATIDVNPVAYDTLVRHDVDVPANPFLPGFVDLRLERSGSPNSALRTYLGEIELSYEALYVTADDAFNFDTGVTGTNADLEVTGFTRSDLLLYEISDEYAPVAVDLSGANLPPDGSGFKLSLHVPQTGVERRRFAVQTLGRIPRLRSANFELDPIADTIAELGAAQVLAVGPESLRAGTEPWLNWRRQNDRHGWIYRYVDVQQIYDQFSGGMKDPAALRQFLYHYFLAHDLRAVLLVGDGNENAREAGPSASRDLIPPSVHSGGYDPYELLASDKWFVLYDLIDDGFDILLNYPNRVNKGPDVLIGRWPVNDSAELNSMVSKVLAYEAPTSAETWRSRALFVADDAYSTGFLGGGQASCYAVAPGEDEFARSQTRSNTSAANALDGVIQSEFWNIEDITASIRVPDPNEPGCFNLAATRQNAESTLAPQFYNKLSQGWLWVSFQGHANWNILAHEALLTLEGARSSIANTNRPFVFFGMGCHVTDFLRAREGVEGRTVGEELLMLGGRGAIATYGSSGFEFLQPNAAFMELITRNFYAEARNSSIVLPPGEFDTPWILAEAMAESERDMVVAQTSFTYRQMVAQYNLLGDPLLRLDAQAPRVATSVGGVPVQPGVDLVPTPGERSLGVGLDIVDETTLNSLRVLDLRASANLADGISPAEILRDHSSLLVFDDPADRRVRHVDLSLPIAAQDYLVVVEAYDAAYPDLRPSHASFRVPMPLTVYRDDEAVQPGTSLVGPGVGAALRIEFTSPIVLTPDEVVVAMTGADLSGTELNSTDGRQWVFAAQISGTDSGQELNLTLAGTTTTLLFAPSAAAGALALHSHVPYPNPSVGPVDIVCEANATVDEVQMWVYDLAGRPVYEATQVVGGQSRFVVSWDGRDLEGDALGNGVYLYRLRVRGATGAARSDVGRIVFMR